jgi:hypothetical protein
MICEVDLKEYLNPIKQQSFQAAGAAVPLRTGCREPSRRVSDLSIYRRDSRK